MKNVFKFGFLLMFVLIPILSFSQTKNPNISIITDFRTFTHDNKAAPSEEGGLNLDLSEIEFAIQGYLNPYARADIFFAKHGVEGPLEIEEAYATFLRGLPFGLNIKAGKYLLDFGKLNTVHPHAFYFIERPLIQTVFFGEDGFNDTGINANILLPTGDIYTNLSFNILKGDFVIPHVHGEEDHGHEEEAEHEEEEMEKEHQPLGYSGRLTTHFQLSDYSNLELGFSGATGIHDSHEDLRLYFGGFDLKYKWRPNRYRSLTFQLEALLNKRDLNGHEEEHEGEGHEEEYGEEEISSVTTTGFFSYLTYQFKKRWNVGVLGEWTQSPESKAEKYWGFGVFAGFSPMEESSVLRLLLKREKQTGFDSYNKILAQLIFSLGPHKPHVF